MKTNFYKSNAAHLRILGGVLIAVCALALAASAELGGDVSTVQNDMARMKGTVKVTEQQGYTVQEITAAGGTHIKEFVSPAGKVFGVSWKGQLMPDLQQLFGAYFPMYSQALQGQSQKRTPLRRRGLNIQEPGLVVQATGHMRSYMGRAYVPELIPEGLNPEVIR